MSQLSFTVLVHYKLKCSFVQRTIPQKVKVLLTFTSKKKLNGANDIGLAVLQLVCYKVDSNHRWLPNRVTVGRLNHLAIAAN